MQRGRILNAELNHAIASMGHGDLMIVCDAGFPIPNNVWRVDLAIVQDIPDLETVLTAASEKSSTPDLGWALREGAEALTLMLGPMMPHLAEECWQLLGHKSLVAETAWPEVEPALLEVDTLLLPVQVNGKKRAELTIAIGERGPRVEVPVHVRDDLLPELAEPFDGAQRLLVVDLEEPCSPSLIAIILCHRAHASRGGCSTDA